MLWLVGVGVPVTAETNKAIAGQALVKAISLDEALYLASYEINLTYPTIVKGDLVVHRGANCGVIGSTQLLLPPGSLKGRQIVNVPIWVIKNPTTESIRETIEFVDYLIRKKLEKDKASNNGKIKQYELNLV